MDKENQHSLANEGVSPPISSRLQELSNNLKLLCSSTSSYDQVFTEIVEPKTPIMEQSRTLDGMKVRSNHFSNTLFIFT